MNEIFEKLKKEWKTFAVALVGTVISAYDMVIAAGLDWTPIVPEKYRAVATFALGFSMLLLRRYKP